MIYGKEKLWKQRLSRLQFVKLLQIMEIRNAEKYIYFKIMKEFTKTMGKASKNFIDLNVYTRCGF